MIIKSKTFIIILLVSLGTLLFLVISGILGYRLGFEQGLRKGEEIGQTEYQEVIFEEGEISSVGGRISKIEGNIISLQTEPEILKIEVTEETEIIQLFFIPSQVNGELRAEPLIRFLTYQDLKEKIGYWIVATSKNREDIRDKKEFTAQSVQVISSDF